jgi:hypothetical protein
VAISSAGDFLYLHDFKEFSIAITEIESTIGEICREHSKEQIVVCSSTVSVITVGRPRKIVTRQKVLKTKLKSTITIVRVNNTH